MKKLVLLVAVALVVVGFTNSVSPRGFKGASIVPSFASTPASTSSAPMPTSSGLRHTPLSTTAAIEAPVSSSESAFLFFLGMALISAGVLLRRRIHSNRTVPGPQAR